MKFQNLLPLLMLLAILFLCAVSGNAQNVRQDKDGNYVSLKAGKPTGRTFTDENGKVYEVFITGEQKLYVMKLRKKTNEPYRSYLKLEPDSK